jgi:hypothetical protein
MTLDGMSAGDRALYKYLNGEMVEKTSIRFRMGVNEGSAEVSGRLKNTD